MEIAITYYREHDGDSLIINESFEVIDKVADCRVLFNQLEGTLSTSWNDMYRIAKAYYETHGDLEVTHNYFTEDAINLGTWISTQRRNYQGKLRESKKLTQVQINKLDAIGMRWEFKPDLLWNQYYSSAKKYYDKHGDLIPSGNYTDEYGVAHGKCLIFVRTIRKTGIKSSFLTADKLTLLDKIEMVWDTIDYIWEENLAEAVKYHRYHGNLNVSKKYVTENGVKLGNWIALLIKKIRKGELPEDKVSRLVELGLDWRIESDCIFDCGMQEL